MATSEELRRIITILDEEGFGALAGELLAEISLGREVEVPAPASEPNKGADDRDTLVVRVPLSEREQLAQAMSMLRLRLVEPVRALAEAERIAGELAEAPGVRIRFIDPEQRTEIEPLSRSAIADGGLADRLGELLDRLPSMIGPPTSTEA
jgi:hypothetical protein